MIFLKRFYQENSLHDGRNKYTCMSFVNPQPYAINQLTVKSVSDGTRNERRERIRAATQTNIDNSGGKEGLPLTTPLQPHSVPPIELLNHAGVCESLWLGQKVDGRRRSSLLIGLRAYAQAGKTYLSIRRGMGEYIRTIVQSL